jgi:shikimate kinase
LVPIARGQHLFPCRTQQLSLGAVTILGVHPWENSTVPNYMKSLRKGAFCFVIIRVVKLVFIYGPMSVGKYTTAKALADLTGYKLFHNHLTVLTTEAIFPEHEPPYSEVIKQVRFIMLEAAAQSGYDTIFTLAYSGKVDNDQLANIVAAVEKAGGKVNFVQLYAPPEELLANRINGQSRHDMKKVTDEDSLKQVLAERDMYAAVPYKNNLRIDNSRLKPEESARRIANHFNLPIAT